MYNGRMQMLAGRSITENIDKGRGREQIQIVAPGAMVQENGVRDLAIREADYTLQLVALDNLNEIVQNVHSIVRENLREKKEKDVRKGIVEATKTRKMREKIDQD